jgi:tetrapyrrole methylase family protein/MazG family protein
LPPLVPVDPLQNRRSFDALLYVTTRLLGPGGCPWDVQQTHQSLRANLLEEAYEVLEALDSGDMDALAEELGDLLFQAFVHSEMARQAGHFDIGDVLEHITSKLIRRHPHVFGDLTVGDSGEVLHNWEQIKAQELARKGRARSSALDGIPAALPALAACQKIGAKAARARFDWPTLEKIWDKLREELAELEHAYHDDQRDSSPQSRAHLAEELGDALYALVQVARWLTIDAESALREANAKFCRRFMLVEQAAQERGQTISDLALDEKIALWQKAKSNVRIDD